MSANDHRGEKNGWGTPIRACSIEIHSYLSRAMPEIRVIAEEIQCSSSLAKVLTEINQLSDGLDLINVYLNSLSAAGLDTDLDISRLIQDLAQSVTSMHDFMHGEDARSMGASLTHELLPTLIEIQAVSFKLSQGE